MKEKRSDGPFARAIIVFNNIFLCNCRPTHICSARYDPSLLIDFVIFEYVSLQTFNATELAPRLNDRTTRKEEQIFKSDSCQEQK
jgi:hypothetical protein